MRWQNLLLILLTQLILLRVVFDSTLYFTTLWSIGHVFFFVATLLIAAAGNALNDFMDEQTDNINKPHRVIVEVQLSRINVFFAYRTCFLLGLLLGEVTALLLWSWELAIIFPLSAYLLKYYSLRFKGTVLLGNIIIAFLCALVPITVYYFAIGCIGNYLSNAIQPMPDLINVLQSPILFFYSFFAFFSTLLREIIKDLEDEEGDGQSGWHTLVVVQGEKKAKQVAALVGVFNLCFILFYFYYSAFDANRLFWGNLLLVAPLLFILGFLYFAYLPSHYHRLSWMCKGWMLCGLVFLMCKWF